MNAPAIGFDLQPIRLPLTSILPIRMVKEGELRPRRYDTILASVREVGLIEPLIVHPQKGKSGLYLLLDGHLRLCALKEIGQTESDCLVSTDDESFTYNARINRLAPIQEHRMIMKAVENGVAPEKIASALNMKLRDIRAMMNLLDGIHETAADLLKDKPITPPAIWLMRKVDAIRQIEMAELLISAHNFTYSYVEALFVGTSKDHLLKPEEPKLKKGLTTEEIAHLENEMESIEHDFRAVDQTYGANVLNFTVTRTYLKKLLENAKVARFLSSKHPDLLSEFEAIIAMGSI
jgi:ParB-like chromosome segregation protein Spo0J